MQIKPIPVEEKQRALTELREAKALFAARGWFAGTSGNLSVRVGDISGATEAEKAKTAAGAERVRSENGARFQFAITASGKDKSQQTPEDFLFVDQDGQPSEPTSLKPSAETLIHCEIYRLTGCGAIYHVHTVFNNLISEWFWPQRAVPIEGVELIKAFNIWDEEAQIDIPIVPNFAHIPSIVPEITAALKPEIPGILLRKHGIYAWGATPFEAKRHLEAFEFLFEYAYRWELLKGSRA